MVAVLTSDIRVRSSEGAEFDCHLALPRVDFLAPAAVLACSIYGVDADLREIAHELARNGCIAAAPDLFWRSTPGPLMRGDPRAVVRGRPRAERISAGQRDLMDVLTALRDQPLFNGRAAVIGFCYGGPYAILGPKRLGYDAGMACHGSQMLGYVDELEQLRRPVCLLWGDRDHEAPESTRDAYRAATARTDGIEMRVFPGVEHGYMMKSKPLAFNRSAYQASMACAVGLVASLASLKGIARGSEAQ